MRGELLQESVFERERRRGGAPASSDLLVDVGDVAIHRGDRDDQLVGDLAGGAAAGQTPQHLQLSSGETGRVLGGRPNLDGQSASAMTVSNDMDRPSAQAAVNADSPSFCLAT